MPFTHEQMQRSAERGLEYECPHVDPERQAEAKADPEMGGLMCMSCARIHELAYMLNQLLNTPG